MKENGERGGVGGQDDEFSGTAVQGFCCFVGAFLQLAVV